MPAPRQTDPPRPTLKDVARRAGVATSTASLAYSGRGPVAEATVERVRAAASELGYTGPDPRASALRSGRAGTVAVLVEGRLLMAFRDPFAISILDGLAESLEGLRSGMLLLSQPSDDPGAVVDQLAGMALDALVFSLCGPAQNPVVEHCAARGIPMFATGRPQDPRVRQVVIDERGASATAGHHLTDLGHRRVATVTMPMSPGATAGPLTEEAVAAAAFTDSRERLLGLRDAIGLESAAWQAADPSSIDDGHAAGLALLGVDAAVRPTAVVAQSDLLALGVIRAAEELGLRVPEDLSVVGFDGIEAPWSPHRLTTVDQHGQAKGRLLGELVAATLSGEQTEDVLQETTLQVGTTTAPPPAP